MKPVIIFGTGTVAKLAWNIITRESLAHIAAFCVDDAYCTQSQFCGLPVLPASSLASLWPPQSCSIFVALGYQKLNALRQEAIERFAGEGYELASCISSHALVMNDGAIGRNAFVMEGCILQPYSVLGDGCICWSGCVVAHESRIGNYCFMAAHSVVGGRTEIGDGTFIGLNAAIRDEVHVGRNCLIGAGSLVLSDLADNSFVAEKGTPTAPYSAQKALSFISI